MFQNFKHQIALQCSKRLTKPMTLTENTSSMSTPNHQFRQKFNFGQNTDKKYRSECIKTSFQVKNYFFSGEGLPQTLPLVGMVIMVTPPHIPSSRPIKPSRSTSASPRIPARFMPLPISICIPSSNGC